MGSTYKIQANPEMLVWAREEAGFTHEELANKLHITVDRFKQWEDTGKNIPLGMLKIVANHYKRQLAVFCLPTPPPKVIKPNDFRNLAKDQSGLSNEVLLTVRRTNKYLNLACELEGDEYWKTKYKWLNDTDTLFNTKKKIIDTEILTWLRKILNISVYQQKKSRSYDIAFKSWRNAIEKKLGIFVFQFPMPENELDGFSYAFKPPFAIVINSSNKLPQRKIFTLFHELGHILKHQSGLCYTDLYRDNQLDLEFECNDFAGKFLIPDSNVYPIDSIEELTRLSQTYKVSREVYLRRSFESELISKKEFFSYLKGIRETSKTKKPKKVSGPVNHSVISRSQRGETFYNMVIDAAYKNRIEFSTASDNLNLNINIILNALGRQRTFRCKDKKIIFQDN